jgi:hypothetical protein
MTLAKPYGVGLWHLFQRFRHGGVHYVRASDIADICNMEHLRFYLKVISLRDVVPRQACVRESQLLRALSIVRSLSNAIFLSGWKVIVEKETDRTRVIEFFWRYKTQR